MQNLGKSAAFALAAAVLATTDGRADFSPLAVSGQPAAGLPGLTYDQLFLGTVSESGDITIRGTVAGPGVDFTNRLAYWVSPSASPGLLALLARAGDQAPGVEAGSLFDDALFSPVVSDGGGACLAAALTGPGITSENGSCVYILGPSGSELMTRSNQPAPGTEAGTIFGPINGNAFFAPSGELFFESILMGPSVPPSEVAWWLGAPGLPGLILRDRTQAMGAPVGVTIDNPTAASFGGGGTMAYVATLLGPGVTVANNQGIFWGPIASAPLAVRKGDSAPGLAAGITFGALYGTTRLGGGRLAFQAFLVGPGVNAGNQVSLWVTDSGGPTILARQGDPAPGASANFDFFGLGSITLNSAGVAAFRSTLAGPGVTPLNNEAMWVGLPGALAMLVRGGDAAPGYPGLVLDSIFDPVMNGAATAVVKAGLSGPGVTAGVNDIALFYSTPTGGLSPLLRTGEPFAIGPGDTRTISHIDLNTVDGGGRRILKSLNEAGRLVFWLRFVEGGWAVVSTTVPPPCPGDVDGNRTVDFGDVTYILGNWGNPFGFADITQALAAWGSPC